MRYRILALLLAACLVFCGCGQTMETTDTAETENGVVAKSELVGQWHLDGAYTQEKSGMSLENFYGALWEDENILQFEEDGSMYYKAGICYGSGKYTVTEKGVRVEFAGEEDEDDAGFTLLIVDKTDVLRIGMDQYGDGNYVYWIKD